MKLQFGIQPEKVKSNVESFEGFSTMTFKPFESKIQGLVFYLKSSFGIVAQIPIPDTTLFFTIPLKTYNFGWFEYTSSDIQYIIDVEVE